VLQEHLSVSREYDDTKTKRGKMKRAAEIIRMVQAHTGAEVTPGSLLFLCETLLDVTAETGPQELRDHLHGAQKVLARHLSMQYGGGHGFPEQCDPQDKCYLPFAKESTAIRPRRFELSAAPAISIVVPVLSGDTGYQQTWASIDQQGYDNVEIVTCGSESLHHAAAINEGLDRARGEILGWLQPGDRLAAGALHEIARAFADDPDLDLVHGNAVHIDAAGSIYLADHGMHLSGVWTESHAASGNVACTGDVVAPFPQPTVFFRRRLLERCGNLDESLRFVYDWDLLARFAKCAKVKKIERIQAFQVAPVDSRNRHNARLIERYRVQRSTWPSVFSPEYPRVLRAFLKGYLRRKFSGRPPRWLYWSAAAFAALAATTRLANPERWWKYRLHIQAGPLWPAPQQKGKRFASIFLGPSLPRANAETPEEVREWQIVRGLSMNSSIEYFNLEQDARESDADSLVSYVDTIHNAKQLAAAFPEFVYPPAARPALRTRMINLLRRWNVPVAGPRYPLHVAEQLPFLRAYFGIIVRHLLHWNRPDFLFVCPQSNPMPLLLTAEPTDTRIIVVAHEVDTDRMESLARAATGLKRRALEAEARRTRTFERENLACCDGILAASESDRERFVSEYGMPAERVFVFTSQDDAGLLAFLARLKALPRRHDAASLPASRTYLRAA
jgi:hypothetical protein